MGILGRLSSLVKSNLNNAIDSMQDPAKEIDQMIRDMEDSAKQARTEVAQCMAEEKRLQKRVADLEGDAADWETRAGTAVRAGDDALAKEALLRKAEKEAERAETQKALQEQGVYVDQLTQALKALDVSPQGHQAASGDAARQGARQQERQPAVGQDVGVRRLRPHGRVASTAVEAEASLDEDLGGRSEASAAAERKLNADGRRELG
jgi:chromosome segregation ATPase